jgi:hypothetical protein
MYVAGEQGGSPELFVCKARLLENGATAVQPEAEVEE